MAVGTGSALATMALAAPASAATPAAGIWIKMAHSNKCLNVSGASKSNLAKIVQYTCSTGATNDKFKLVPRGKGNYWIQGVGSGRCLNVAGASKSNNALIIQYTCSDSLNTLWKVDEVPNQPTVQFRSANSNRCLNLPKASTANNVQLIQYSCSATAKNDKFYLPPTASATATKRAFTKKQPITVLQGGATGLGGVAPIYYSYVTAENSVLMITDFDPDGTNPNAPDAEFWETDPDSFTGRTQASVLSNGRVQVAAHESDAGDVTITDEAKPGNGQYPYYYDIGGSFAGQPTVGPLVPKSTLATYAIVNGALWFAPQQVNNPQTPYGAWRSLGGTGLTGTPVISALPTGVRITALTTSGTLQTATLVNNTLSGWTNLGGSGLSGTPSVVVTGNQASIFVRAGDGTVVTKKQSSTGSFPADWSPLAGLSVTGSPSAVLDAGAGQIAVLVRGADNLIYLGYETAAGSGAFYDWSQISDPADPSTASLSDPTAFAYNLPSGKSFGVAFQSADNIDYPFVYTFPPSAAKAAKGTTTVPQGKLHKLEKSESEHVAAN